MKHMTQEELKAYGDTLPLWSTRDAQGNELTYKDSNGDWGECTRDAQGNELTYKDSDGDWRGFSNEDIDKERARLKQVRKNLKRSRK